MVALRLVMRKHRSCNMDEVWIGCNLLCVLLLIQCFQLILQLSDLLLQAACLSLRQRSEMLLRFSLLLSGFAQSLNTCEQSRSSVTHSALLFKTIKYRKNQLPLLPLSHTWVWESSWFRFLRCSVKAFITSLCLLSLFSRLNCSFCLIWSWREKKKLRKLNLGTDTSKSVIQTCHLADGLLTHLLL